MKGCGMLRFCLLLSVWASSLPLYADWKTYTPKELMDMEVHLVSMGPSHDLFTSGGHTLLRIVDPAANSDLMYNWGAFSEEDPLFLWSFMRGTSQYYLIVEPTVPTFQNDVTAYPRDVFQDRVALTVLQKKKLLQEIQTWIEHPAYQYHIWSKNCSTLVSELLDHATNGGISRQLQGKKATVTYRELWMTYFGSWPILAVAADFLLNGKADPALTQWELRFTPLLFRQHLQSLFAIEDTGAISTQPLLSNTIQLYKHPVPYGVGERGYQVLLVFFACLALLGLAAKKLRQHRLAYASLAIAQTLWGLFSFAVSTAILAISLISTREYFYFSAVLWVFWPLDLFFIGGKGSEKRQQIQSYLVRLHLIGWVGLGICYATGVVQQSLIHIGLYMIPISALIFLQRAYIRSDLESSPRLR